MVNKYNHYRWADEEEYVKKTFEKIMLNKCSKLEQIRFIENETNKEPIKLKALQSDLLDFIEQIESWSESYDFFKRMVQRISPDFDPKIAIQDFSDIVDEYLRDQQKSKNSSMYFDNKDWIINTFKMVHIDISQNKALEKTRELYELEFDLKAPGKTTILRYLGKTE